MFPKPLTSPTEIEQLQEEGAVSRLTYVGDAITLTRHKIEGKVPLIGFTGAPVSYLLQVLGLYILIIIQIVPIHITAGYMLFHPCVNQPGFVPISFILSGFGLLTKRKNLK